MGFKSVMKKIGKVALKVAPYAAMAIPGVGPIASMAIQAGLGAANAKVSGQGLKGVLLGAGTGALTSKLGGFGSAGKGIAPSAGAVASGVAKNTAGSVAKQIAKNVGMGAMTGGLTNGITSALASPSSSSDSYQPSGLGPSSVPSGMNSSTRTGTMPRYGQNPLNQYNQNTPNLAEALNQGRQEAIRNQPFRSGYDVTTYIGKPDEEGKYETKTTKMPPIYSSSGSRGNRRSQPAAY